MHFLYCFPYSFHIFDIFSDFCENVVNPTSDGLFWHAPVTISVPFSFLKSIVHLQNLHSVLCFLLKGGLFHCKHYIQHCLIFHWEHVLGTYKVLSRRHYYFLLLELCHRLISFLWIAVLCVVFLCLSVPVQESMDVLTDDMAY